MPHVQHEFAGSLIHYESAWIESPALHDQISSGHPDCEAERLMVSLQLLFELYWTPPPRQSKASIISLNLSCCDQLQTHAQVTTRLYHIHQSSLSMYSLYIRRSVLSSPLHGRHKGKAEQYDLR